MNDDDQPRGRADATIVAPPPAAASTADAADEAGDGDDADSYQSTERPLAGADSPSVDAIVAQIRQRAADRLTVHARIASGGMGVVDAAIDRALDRRVAIKTLHPHLRADAAAVRMFLREARVTGALDHPHVVPVYELGERADGDLFFAMKLVEGRTLSAWIHALPPTPLDTATLYALLDVIVKVADALAFAHSRGILHCDIKPANIMVGDFGQVYLMDWGIARITSVEGRPPSPPAVHPALGPLPCHGKTDNAVVGTPCYMSPEQARGDRALLDARSDVFLLGGVLYEMLARRPPYDTADRNETLSLALAGVFPSPRKVAGHTVPVELDRIVMRAMAKAPTDRYPSVHALREDLTTFMRGGAEFPRRVASPGEVVVREGERGEAAFIVVDGACEVRKDSPTGPQVLGRLGPGDVFGEMAILTRSPRTATVVAIAPTTLLVVTGSALAREMDALKPWMARLLTSLAERFRDVDAQQRATFMAAPPPSRIANLVFMHAAAWGSPDGNGGVTVPLGSVTAEVEATLGPPSVLGMFGAIAHYGLGFDAARRVVRIPSLDGLRQRLAVDLKR